ncbi:MAG: CotH kinase family protein [Saprospiraceae bacterium]|nr:CotH kinase family protein [Saprospiraceae bacterium]
MQFNYKLLIVLLFVFGKSFGQSGNKIFDQSYLHEIRITFADENYWETLNNNFESLIPGEPSEDAIPYLTSSVKIDGTAYDHVGVRFKGYSSFLFVPGKKRPFKLDFNEFVDNRTIDGLRKLNLNNGVGDPAFQRDFICYNLLRKMGIPAPRVAFVKLYLNDEYWGLYTMVEQIDKSFLKDNYADNDGSLYKNIGWSNLEYNGDRKSDYPEFEKKTKESEPWTDFIDLIKKMNSSKITYKSDLESLFEVDDYLKVLAVDMITGNWDSYHFHGRNWYLYKDSTSNKFHWQPWDYNLALGGTFNGGHPVVPGDSRCTFRSKIEYVIDDNSKCTMSICGIDQLSDVTVSWYVDEIHKGNAKSINAIMPSGGLNVAADINYRDNENVCKLNLSEFIIAADQWIECPSVLTSAFTHNVNDSRIQEVLHEGNCCEIWGSECEEFLQNLQCRRSYDSILNLQLFGFEYRKVLNSKLLEIPEYYDAYTKNVCKAISFMTNEAIMPGVYKNVAMIKDAVESDKNYVFLPENFKYDISVGNNSSPIPSIPEFIRKRKADLTKQLSNAGINCAVEPTEVLNWHDVVVNELVASNTEGSGIVDEKGEYDDWIELFNNSAKEINLTSYYLSDNNTNLTKWAFPENTKIAPGGYLIIWADENKTDGPLHCNFKLSKTGEQLYLSNGQLFVDSLNFKSLGDNQSFSRIPNGTGEFVIKNTTFGFDNSKTSSTSIVENNGFQIFPNPASNGLNVRLNTDIKEVSVFDVTGRKMNVPLSINDAQAYIDIASLHEGIFFIEVKSDNFGAIRKFIKR